MAVLSKDQIETFHRDGAIVVPDVVTPQTLGQLKATFSNWVEESRGHDAPYGRICDGRPRFDLDEDHSSTHPSLRRVASPTDVSEVFARVAFDSAMTDIASDLLGADLRFHHAKVNSKLPRTKTVVKWHQDFPFDPHSNDDTLTALLFLDEVTEDNGPLLIAPGSHHGPILSHFQNDVFTGSVSDEDAARFQSNSVSCSGPAGAVCLMHSRVAHASTANNSADILSPMLQRMPRLYRQLRCRVPIRARSFVARNLAAFAL